MLYRMAGYCRLSKEDGENRISESIENQKKLKIITSLGQLPRRHLMLDQLLHNNDHLLSLI